MIQALALSNVRLFEGGPWRFALPALTVFCGTNSAGKSTVLKVPLVLRQTQEYDSSTARVGVLRLSGRDADLGTFADLISFNDTSRDATIGVEVPTRLARSTTDWLRSLGQAHPVPRPRQRRGADKVSAVFSASFSFTSLAPAESDGAEADTDNHLLRHADFKLLDGDTELLHWELVLHPATANDGPRYFLRLPKAFAESEFAGYGAYEFSGPDGGDDDAFAAGVRLRGLLPDALLARMGGIGEEAKTFEAVERPLPLPIDISGPLDALNRAIRGVHYLGPLRSAAERFYVAAAETSPAMDPSGDFLPYILRDHGDRVVSTVSPGDTAVVELTLAQALDSWLHYLRTGETDAGDHKELSVAATKRVLVELQVRGATGEGAFGLADSGFGYSQVLPILVRGLLAAPGDTLIIEQPELHLHPALQIRLAQFVTAMARSGRQLLLETHSEHLVNAIRVAAAEDPSGDLAGMTEVLYIDAEQRPPHVHQLGVQADGSVPDWPPQFFGEALSLTGRLLRAQKLTRAGQ